LSATTGGRVGGGVVGDRDPPRFVEQLAESIVQRADAVLEGRLLVVHGHDDVESESVGKCSLNRRSLGIGHDPMLGGRAMPSAGDSYASALNRFAGR